MNNLEDKFYYSGPKKFCHESLKSAAYASKGRPKILLKLLKIKKKWRRTKKLYKVKSLKPNSLYECKKIVSKLKKVINRLKNIKNCYNFRNLKPLKLPYLGESLKSNPFSWCKNKENICRETWKKKKEKNHTKIVKNSNITGKKISLLCKKFVTESISWMTIHFDRTRKQL